MEQAMKADIPQHPHKWLLNELRSFLSDEQYQSMIAAHDRVKRRYDLSSKLRATRTELRTYERAYANTSDEQKRGYAAKIERRKARIVAIEKELAEL